jgi:hypothetical protein
MGVLCKTLKDGGLSKFPLFIFWFDFILFCFKQYKEKAKSLNFILFLNVRKLLKKSRATDSLDVL